MRLSKHALADLCDVVQVLFDRYDIVTTNPAKEEAMLDEEDLPIDEKSIHPTTIYGEDWDELELLLSEALKRYNIEFDEEFE